MNLFDSAVSYFSPEAGIRRARARQALQDSVRLAERDGKAAEIRRAAATLGYDAAKTGRRLDGWFRPGTSANSETRAAIKVLRDGAREMVRNNPLAAKGLIEFENKLVGTGIRPMARTGDGKTDKIIDTAFAQWSPQCTASRHPHYYGIQKLAARCIPESGEALLRHRYRFAGDGPKVTVEIGGKNKTFEIPYQVQLIEPDYLDNSRDIETATGYIIQGIEHDMIGRRTGYYLFGGHPGDSVNTGWFNRVAWLSARVDAQYVEHGFRMDRPEQVRGVTWLAPIMAALYDLDGYEDAERVRKRGEACLMAFVTQAAADETNENSTVTGKSVQDGDGKRIEEFAPGMVTYLPAGASVTVAEPKANSGHIDYVRGWHRTIAAGWGLLYELLTGDLSQTNYSSYRGGAVSFRDFIEAIQWTVLIPFVCDPVYQRFVDALRVAGAIPTDTPYTVEWGPPPFDLLDRGAETEADERMVRIGSMTWPQMIARQGYDPEEQYAQILKWTKRFKADGIVLDCDPSQTARSGIIQQQPGFQQQPQ